MPHSLVGHVDLNADAVALLLDGIAARQRHRRQLQRRGGRRAGIRRADVGEASRRSPASSAHRRIRPGSRSGCDGRWPVAGRWRSPDHALDDVVVGGVALAKRSLVGIDPARAVEHHAKAGARAAAQFSVKLFGSSRSLVAGSSPRALQPRHPVPEHRLCYSRSASVAAPKPKEADRGSKGPDRGNAICVVHGAHHSKVPPATRGLLYKAQERVISDLFAKPLGSRGLSVTWQ